MTKTVVFVTGYGKDISNVFLGFQQLVSEGICSVFRGPVMSFQGTRNKVSDESPQREIQDFRYVCNQFFQVARDRLLSCRRFRSLGRLCEEGCILAGGSRTLVSRRS